MAKLPKLGRTIGKIGLNNSKIKARIEKNAPLLEERKKRVYDTIYMENEPDRVPTHCGVSFFPAKYAGITCEEFMFDAKKNQQASLKVCDDFDLDMNMNSHMYPFGRIVELVDFKLIKLPGREITPNSMYQYNEIDRFTTEEYKEFAKDYEKFFHEKIQPQLIGLLTMKRMEKIKRLSQLSGEGLKLLRHIMYMELELKARGEFCFYSTPAFNPFDIWSFAFRTIESMAKDLMKKQIREQIIDMLEYMRPTVMKMWLWAAQMFPGQTGIYMQAERAFSLSPRQFERYQWPTLKPMIVELVENGLNPILMWEQDTTHLIHFLKELPTNISRKCVYSCDMADIIQADKILDGHMAIWGGLPLSTMCVGTPKDIEKRLDEIFPVLKPHGGFAVGPALMTPD
ncbi:MAG: hypothetical protein GY870_01665, partial [archaeon]|nr:hypothetical protein [archaeon]